MQENLAIPRDEQLLDTAANGGDNVGCLKGLPEGMLAVIWNATSDIIWAVDVPDFRLTWWNHNLETTLWEDFGVVPASGMTSASLFGDSDEGESWADRYGRALSEGGVQFECDDSFGAIRHCRVIPIIVADETIGIAAFCQDITERRSAERARDASEATLRQTFMAIPDALYLETADDGRIVNCNPAFERIFGYSRDESVGNKKLTSHLWLDAGQRQRIVQGVEESGFVMDIDAVGRRKNGQTFPVRLSACQVELGEQRLVAVTARDVSRLIETEANLRLVQFSVDHVGELVCVTDMEGHILTVNDYGCARMGYSLEELVGSNATDILMTPEFGLGDLTETLKREGNARTEVNVLTKDGGIFPSEVNVTYFNLDGREYLCAIGREITDRKNSERQLANALDQVKQAQVSTIEVLSSLTELHDPYTAGHQHEVARIALEIARGLGLSGERMRGLEIAALLHDVGKACVPIEILSFPGKLAPSQRRLVETHSRAGYELLKPIAFPWRVAEMVLQHHERIDGSGYPEGLTGEDLMLESKILAVADTAEAMSSHRPHRRAFTPSAIRDELLRLRGVTYDSEVVDAYLRFVERTDRAK